MIRSLALTAAAMAAFTVPAHAHGAHHTHVAKNAPAMTAAGVCDMAVSKANMLQVFAC